MSAVSVIIPASNEAGLIRPCLHALCASAWPFDDPVEAVVVANGCSDDTAAQARACLPLFAARGWDLRVLEQAQGGKIPALNAGDGAASHALRAYLDADVTLEPRLLAQLHDALADNAPRYASGRVRIVARGPVSRAYARIWRQVPFMATGVPGCGLFAVNAAGRARWAAFPPVISDDTFVRLQFTPKERIAVQASYDWPIAEGLEALIRVRRRQDAGVDEIARLYPDLPANDDDRPFPTRARLAIALRDPLGFAIYVGVAVASRLTRHRAKGWSRGR